MSEVIGFVIGMAIAGAVIYFCLWVEELWDHRKYSS